ncbi:MAG: ABC transporter ATP-binding protein [Acidimicrobiia bacterium]
MIETHGLVKRFGATTALDHVDLRVPTGSVYGLVGPNGAGKTTLLGILAGLRTATAGSSRIGVDRSQMAVLPDTPQFDPWLTAREVVDLARVLTDDSVARDRVEEVLAEAGLADDADRRVGGFSRGMLQRLGIAATVVAGPRLVILDEPSAALDPLGRRDVLDLVSRLRGEATVLFSSHILSDVQEVCDTVGVLRGGELLYQGPIDELLVGTATPSYLVRIRPPVQPAVEALRTKTWVTGVDTTSADMVRVSVTSVEDAERHLTEALTGLGVRVVSLGPEAATLEDVYLELTS